LIELGVEIHPEEELIIRREINSRGKSRNFINSRAFNVSDLKSTGNFLVDIHGQNDHQLLFDNEFHRRFLDDFGSLKEGFSAYKSLFKDYKGIKKT